MNALSTWCRDRLPAVFAARVRGLGVTELALDGSLEDGETEALLAALPGVAVVAVAARGGPRAPRLCSEDKDERLAAVRAVTATIARAGELGARAVVVELGALAVRHDEAALLRAFARRQLESETVARLVGERRALSPRALDLCRFGLDRVLDPAGAAGLRLALANRPRWLDVPSAGEIASLLEDFRGAPLASWYDAAAAHIRRTLGFGGGRPAVEVEAAAGAWLTDAAGPRGALPWGTGDVDPAVLAKLPAGAPRVVHAAPPVLDQELLTALT